MFEEADGIWINLQGKDRAEGIEKAKKEYEKKEKNLIKKKDKNRIEIACDV